MVIDTLCEVIDTSSLIISSETDDEARTTIGTADGRRSAPATEPARARCTLSCARASI